MSSFGEVTIEDPAPLIDLSVPEGSSGPQRPQGAPDSPKLMPNKSSLFFSPGTQSSADLISSETSTVSTEEGRVGESSGAASDDQLKGYALFLDQLKDAATAGLVARVKQFVVKFPFELKREQAAERVHAFMSILEDEITQIPIFAATDSEYAREGLEKLMLKPLHQHLFCIDPNDKVLDEQLKAKIARIAPLINLHDHLHGPAELVDDSVLELAIEEFRRMDSYRAPRDKLQCILNAFRVIRHALDEVIGPSAWGADQLLPVCIYTILRANPASLNSNVNFVASFRHPSRLRGEDEYLLMQVNIAIKDIMEIEEVLLKRINALTIQDVARMFKRYRKLLLDLVDLPDLPDAKIDGYEKLLTTEWIINDISPFIESYKQVVAEARTYLA